MDPLGLDPAVPRPDRRAHAQDPPAAGRPGGAGLAGGHRAVRRAGPADPGLPAASACPPCRAPAACCCSSWRSSCSPTTARTRPRSRTSTSRSSRWAPRCWPGRARSSRRSCSSSRPSSFGDYVAIAARDRWRSTWRSTWRCGSASASPRCSGEAGILLLTRVSGLLLSAIAVQLVADAVRGFVDGRPRRGQAPAGDTAGMNRLRALAATLLLALGRPAPAAAARRSRDDVDDVARRAPQRPGVRRPAGDRRRRRGRAARGDQQRGPPGVRRGAAGRPPPTANGGPSGLTTAHRPAARRQRHPVHGAGTARSRGGAGGSSGLGDGRGGPDRLGSRQRRPDRPAGGSIGRRPRAAADGPAAGAGTGGPRPAPAAPRRARRGARARRARRARHRRGRLFSRSRSRRQAARELQGYRADVESLYDRLGADVATLRPGDDAVARQALADAAERYNATGALLSQADTPGEFEAARRTVAEGLAAARVARTRLGLDPGPDVPPPPGSGPQLQAAAAGPGRRPGVRRQPDVRARAGSTTSAAATSAVGWCPAAGTACRSGRPCCSAARCPGGLRRRRGLAGRVRARLRGGRRGRPRRDGGGGGGGWGGWGGGGWRRRLGGRRAAAATGAGGRRRRRGGRRQLVSRRVSPGPSARTPPSRPGRGAAARARRAARSAAPARRGARGQVGGGQPGQPVQPAGPARQHRERRRRQRGPGRPGRACRAAPAAGIGGQRMNCAAARRVRPDPQLRPHPGEVVGHLARRTAGTARGVEPDQLRRRGSARRSRRPARPAAAAGRSARAVVRKDSTSQQCTQRSSSGSSTR